MKILIIKNDGLGDLILSSGIISQLSNKFASSLDLVTCESNKEIASKIKGIKKTYYISRDSIKQYSILNPKRIKPPLKKAKDDCTIVRLNQHEEKAIKEINENNYDLVIVLRRYIRQSSLQILNKIYAKNKLCMWEYPTNLSYTLAKELSKSALHLSSIQLNKFIRPELEYYEAILSKYFNTQIKSNPELNIEISKHLKNTDTIGIVISGSSINISSENWAKVCTYLLNKKFKIILFGGKEQISEANELQKLSSNILSYVGKYGFDDYPLLFSNVYAIIGNDTGLTHFASLIHNKILVIVGGGTFKSFFPWRETGPQLISYVEFDCFYCLWNCTNIIKHECINKVFEDRNIFKNIDLLINS